jgi:acetolactate synthase I/II/III large subunit
MQFAHSAPKGPVYLVGAREALEEEIEPIAVDPALWPPLAPCAIPPEAATAIANELLTAKRPLVVTSYLVFCPLKASK